METNMTNGTNALLHKKGQFLIKNQVIFQYDQPITAKQVLAQVKYVLGKKGEGASVEVKQLHKSKRLFLVSGPGVHTWNPELVAHGPIKYKPIPPPPPPVYPVSVWINSVLIRQEGLKNVFLTQADLLKNG